MSHYPKLPPDLGLTLNLISSLAAADPDYFGRQCPYAPETIAALRKLIGGETGDAASGENLFAGLDEEGELLVFDEQIQKVLSDLDQMGKMVGGMEPNERLAYYKTKTTLVEKLIALREKTNGLRELNEFRTTLLRFIEETCTKSQVAALKERLNDLR